MVEIKDLYKTYGKGDGKVEALNGISLTVEKGEIYGVIGLSGAGKSSLVRCINLLERPDSGQVIVEGQDLTNVSNKDLRVARKKIGMIFQHFNLLMNSTVYDNIAFPLRVSKKPEDFVKKKVAETLELVGLSDKKDVYPAMLSGGQKQRVGIARAIAAEPSLIMSDEATSALDPSTTKSILHLLKEINRKLNMTMIVITHEMEVIKEICDKVAVLENGSIIERGSVADVFVTPKTATARKFFKSVDTDIDNDIYKRAINDNALVIKAVFLGETSTDPYICNMIRRYNVEVAILLGNIQHINDMLIGTLVIKVKGGKEDTKSSINYLRDNGVLVEVLYDVVG